MPSITLKDELLYQKLKKYAEETNTTISDITEDMVFDFLTRKGKDTSAFDDYYIRKEDLEVQATNLINTTLPAHIAAFAKEIAYLNLKIPLWQHLMGIYRLAHDQGQFPAPFLDTAWSSVKITAQHVFKCKNCGKTAELKRLGQRFCNNNCAAEYERKHD